MPKFVVSPLTTDPGLFSELTPQPHSGAHTRSWQQNEGRCKFSTQGIGVPANLWQEDPWVRYSQKLVGRLSAKVLGIDNRNLISLMPFDILNCLSDHSPTSRRGPTWVLWVLVERNRFFQLCPTALGQPASHSLLSFSPSGDIATTCFFQPQAVLPWGGRRWHW